MNITHGKNMAHIKLMLAASHPEVAKLLLRTPKGSRDTFRPLDEIGSVEELTWILDHIARSLNDRVHTVPRDRNGYLVLVDTGFSGHPVFLLSTLYVLMAGGARIHVRYNENFKGLASALLDALTSYGFVKRFVPKDPFSDSELSRYFQNHGLFHLVSVGDFVNVHGILRLAASLGDIRVHLPSAHLLITDYENEPVFTDKLDQFDRLCWAESFDYSGYRAPTNRAEEVCFGFDYCDLFWNADSVVRSLNALPGMRDRIACILFTDHPQSAWLPEGIEKCCTVNDYSDSDFDPFYPVYDFTQLLD